MGFNVTALAQKARTKTLIVDSDLDMGQYDVIATDVKGDTAEFSEFVGGVGNFADITFQGNEPSGYAPIGSIVAYSSNNAPNGWLICNGSAVSRETYNELFNVINTNYGQGDGTTTFNLPDLSGKVVIGVSNTHALGSTGGEETHVLTIAEIPSHTHSVPCGRNKGSATYCYDDGGAMMAHQSTTPATGSAGGGQAHNNMQPYITLNYIIRAI